jgi:hypothetical protein
LGRFRPPEHAQRRDSQLQVLFDLRVLDTCDGRDELVLAVRYGLDLPAQAAGVDLPAQLLD